MGENEISNFQVPSSNLECEKNCGTCRWWEPCGENSGHGECCLNPPVVVFVNMGPQDSGDASYFPKTTASQRCGRWEANGSTIDDGRLTIDKEIEQLGRMLTATRVEDKNRLTQIINRLSDIRYGAKTPEPPARNFETLDERYQSEIVFHKTVLAMKDLILVHGMHIEDLNAAADLAMFYVNESRTPTVGTVENVRIFEKALTANEVKAVHSKETKGQEGFTMNSKEAIGHIEDDLVCANACPQNNKAHYDITKCTCYKKEIIQFILRISETTVYAVEKKDLEHPGCVLNRYIGDCGDGTMGTNVEFDKAYKFCDRNAAAAFLQHCALAFSKQFIDADAYEITSHGMVS